MPDTPGLDIDYIARLARLALTADEREAFARQLGDVLAYVRQLEEVDVTGIEPTAHAFPLENVWAEDEPGPTLPVPAALRNAPAARDGMFQVPKVVE